jgi:NDP-sugar pyrophosphorylase family protein
MTRRLQDLPVAVLAGGLATRLGVLSAARPKSLVPVAGRPFVDHQLELLHRRGLRRVVLCLGHLGEQVAAHVGDGSRYGLEVGYSFDGPRPLGTAGALRQAARQLGDAFWVLYGDSYLDFDYAAALEAFERSRLPALMVTYRNDGRWERSNVLYREGRIVVYDKRRQSLDMVLVDYGASVLTSPLFARLPATGPADLADLQCALAAEGQLAGFEAGCRFFEVGSPAGLEETERHLLAATVGGGPKS